MQEMTSRERFLRALRLEETDRVPITFSYVDPYRELTDQERRLGFDRFHRLVREETDVMLPRGPKAPGIYFSSTKEARIESKTWEEGDTTFRCDTLYTPEGELEAKRKSEREVFTSWTYEGFIKTEEDVEKILSIPYEPLEIDITPVEEAQERVGSDGIVATGVGDPICSCAEIFTLRDYALTATRNPRLIKRLLDFFGKRTLDYVKATAEQTQDVFYRVVGPEYVTPPILNPKFFDEYVVPYDRELIKAVKKTDNIACIHCHGLLRTVMGGMRKIDPQALEPIEPVPKGDIPLNDVKERLGDRTCLMGYIQYNDLEFDTPEIMRKKVRSAIQQGAAGGGYVLFPTAEPIARINDRMLANMREFVSAGRKYGQRY